jgi:hypothetical protein
MSTQREAQHIYDTLRDAHIGEVDLGFARYKLLVADSLPDDEWAHTDTDLHEIVLHASLDDGRAREFLMHELTHCVLEIVGYTSEDADAVYSDTNEDMTIKLSRGWLLLLRLNPDLVSIIAKN